jgi:hypothetical protein
MAGGRVEEKQPGFNWGLLLGLVLSIELWVFAATAAVEHL